MAEQAVAAEPGWEVVRRRKEGGPLILRILYWIHSETPPVLQAMTPLGKVPVVGETPELWYFLKNPDGRYFVPGEPKTFNREDVERWVAEKNQRAQHP